VGRSREDVSSAARIGRAPLSVLVVDDDPGSSRALGELLETDGYTPIQAASGDEALAKARESSPDLVITEVRLPGASGYEVCRRLREWFGEQLPILFLSGSRTEPYDRAAGLHFGADDYVVKPFDPEELLARVRALLRRSRSPASRARAEGASSLTPREREILGLLAKGASQAEISERLFITRKTVAKHIEHVLQKLGAHSRAEAVAAAYRDRLIESS
jgi:DNA-binding NarL/FixJ family response regulator